MPTIKNPKAIQSKSRSHTARQIGDGLYEVTSGASGQTYTVCLLPHGGAGCTCDWSKYRPASNQGQSGCSHVVAVFDHIAAQSGRSASAWANETEAARQHRPAFAIGDGVVLTTRRK